MTSMVKCAASLADYERGSNSSATIKKLISFFIVGAIGLVLIGCSDGGISSGVSAPVQSGLTATDEEQSTTETSNAVDYDSEDEDALIDLTEGSEVVQSTSGLDVAHPNGGQTWTAGKRHLILWSKGKGGATVRINLLKGGKHYLWITNSTSNDGRLVWTIPSDVPAGKAYQIKITSLKNSKIFDKSDKTFTIKAAPTGQDGIDLSKVGWLHTNVSKWKVTSTVKVYFSGSNICFNFADTNRWPAKTILHTSGTRYVQVNANPWVFVNRGGKWYGGTFEWMAPGKMCKPKYTVAGDHIKKDPLKTFKPRKGETLYFMVSALARGGPYKATSRTNVVKVIWP